MRPVNSDSVPLREYLKEQHDAVIKRLDAIQEQTTKTNGRMNDAERDIAILQWAYALGVPVIAWIVYKIA